MGRLLESSRPRSGAHTHPIWTQVNHFARFQILIHFRQFQEHNLINLVVSFNFRKATNQYTLLIHSPVGADKKIGQWIGPIFYLSMPGIKMLRTYLETMHKEICFDPDHQDEAKDEDTVVDNGGEEEEMEEEEGEDEIGEPEE